MNRTEAKELLPIIQAYADGKQIQYFEEYTRRWEDITAPSWIRGISYRVKPESKYRPFRNTKECWQEMLKHQPFGWVKINGQYTNITKIDNKDLSFCAGLWYQIRRDEIVKDNVTFADGAPFGVKVG